MGFMVVGDHDGAGHPLSNQAVLIILDREDDLEPEFLILVTAVACNPHWGIHLHGTVRDEWLFTVSSRFRGRLACRCLPVLDLLRVEDNDAFGFVLIP